MDKKFNILILRGLARQRGHWGDFLHVLENSQRFASVHCLDLPGFGDQAHRKSPITINDIYTDLRSRFTPLKNQNDLPWVVLGVSLGGMVLMEWAKSYPDDFKTFFIVNSSSADTGLPWQRFHPLFTPQLLKAYPKGNYAIEEVVVNRITNQIEDKKKLIAEWAKLADETPLNLKNVGAQIAAASIYNAPKNLFANMCFMASANDRLVDVSCSQKLSERYSAPLFVHPTAGHEVCLDDPLWSIQKIEQHIETLS